MSTVRSWRRPLRARGLRLAVIGGAVMISALLPVAQGSAHAAAHHGVYRPKGASFAAAFPAKPRIEGNTDPLFADFPGAEAAHGYYVSGAASDPLAKSPVNAPAPSYLVLTALYETAQDAHAAAVLSASADHLVPTTIDGLPAYQATGAVRTSTPQGSATRPAVVESITLVVRGDQMFVAFAFTRSAGTADAFTHSIRIAPPAADSTTSPSDGAVTASGAAGPQTHSAAYRDGEKLGGVLVGLAAVGVLLWALQRKRTAAPVAPPVAGFIATPAGPSNPSFGWMYQDAAAPVEPLADGLSSSAASGGWPNDAG